MTSLAVHRSPLLVAAAIVLSGCETVPEPAADSFDATLSRHINAIQSRDMAGMEATITLGDELVLIFPDGERLSTREEYLDFHRSWFADNRWVMTLEPVSQWKGSDYGYALFRYVYDPDGPGDLPGKPSYLSLGFRLENGGWRLVHDQNTRIEQQSAP